MKARYTILFALGLSASAAALSPASAGTPVFQRYACTQGSFLVGFTGRTGVWIDQLRPVCAPFNPKTQRLGTPFSDTTFGNDNGGQVPGRAVCGSMQAVIGVRFGNAHPHGLPGHIQNLDLTCGNIFDLQQTGDKHPQMLSDSGARTLGQDCLISNIAAGIDIGLDGTNITYMGLLCDAPSAIMHAAAPGKPVDLSIFHKIPHSSLPGGTAVHPIPLPSTTLPTKVTPNDFPKHPLGFPTKPVPPPPPPAPVAPSKFVEGDWKTSQGTITFEQDGRKLLGSYDDGGRIVARRDENGDWVGTWSEAHANHRCDKARVGTHFWGEMSFTFTDKNRHFEGVWTYCGAKIPTGKAWIGDRIK